MPASSTSVPGKKTSWLWPREHGATAMMAFPQVTALLLGHGSRGAILLALGVAGIFLVHEPAQVALGRRGSRRQREAGNRARGQTVLLAGLAGALGFAGLAGASRPVWIAALAVLPFAALALGQMISGREKSVGGELLVALTFAAAAVPTALAGGVAPGPALAAAAVWSGAFGLGTLAVRTLIARFKTGSDAGARGVIVLALGLAAGAVAGALLAGGTARAFLGILPPGLVAAGVLAAGMTPRRLRTLGWSMVTADLLVLAVLWVTLR